MDTIFARATAPGRSGVAIVRISGPEAHDVATKICGSLPVKRGLRTIRTSEHEVLDEALVLSFENDKSFTGERVVEFHLHGSPAVVQSVMEMLASEHDLRMAEPGEFTRRALENGKLDLAQVEGLADLIDAETEVQRRQALRVFQGSLGYMAEKWRQKLIRAAALIEATIDFADEEIPENVLLEAREILDQVVAELKSECVGVDAAERIREGFEIAIIGEPNVGKSSLINALAKRSVAIVSDVPGTTRDAIEVKMEIAGYPVILVDTAGIRESSDKVERMGIEIARARAAQADLRILLYEKTAPSAQNDLSADLVFGTKSDRYSYDGLSISVTTEHGIDTLVSNISDRLKTLAQPAGMAIRKRHKFAMARAIDYLELASRMLHDQASVDIVSDEVRSGISAIDSLVGRVDVEDLLDDIFHSFCIGK